MFGQFISLCSCSRKSGITTESHGTKKTDKKKSRKGKKLKKDKSLSNSSNRSFESSSSHVEGRPRSSKRRRGRRHRKKRKRRRKRAKKQRKKKTQTGSESDESGGSSDTNSSITDESSPENETDEGNGPEKMTKYATTLRLSLPGGGRITRGGPNDENEIEKDAENARYDDDLSTNSKQSPRSRLKAWERKKNQSESSVNHTKNNLSASDAKLSVSSRTSKRDVPSCDLWDNPDASISSGEDDDNENSSNGGSSSSSSSSSSSDGGDSVYSTDSDIDSLHDGEEGDGFDEHNEFMNAPITEMASLIASFDRPDLRDSLSDGSSGGGSSHDGNHALLNALLACRSGSIVAPMSEVTNDHHDWTSMHSAYGLFNMAIQINREEKGQMTPTTPSFTTASSIHSIKHGLSPLKPVKNRHQSKRMSGKSVLNLYNRFSESRSLSDHEPVLVDRVNSDARQKQAQIRGMSASPPAYRKKKNRPNLINAGSLSPPPSALHAVASPFVSTNSMNMLSPTLSEHHGRERTIDFFKKVTQDNERALDRSGWLLRCSTSKRSERTGLNRFTGRWLKKWVYLNKTHFLWTKSEPEESVLASMDVMNARDRHTLFQSGITILQIESLRIFDDDEDDGDGEDGGDGKLTDIDEDEKSDAADGDGQDGQDGPETKQKRGRKWRKKMKKKLKKNKKVSRKTKRALKKANQRGREFNVITEKHCHRFRAKTRKERDEWVRAIQKHIVWRNQMMSFVKATFEKSSRSLALASPTVGP